MNSNILIMTDKEKQTFLLIYIIQEPLSRAIAIADNDDCADTKYLSADMSSLRNYTLVAQERINTYMSELKAWKWIDTIYNDFFKEWLWDIDNEKEYLAYNKKINNFMNNIIIEWLYWKNEVDINRLTEATVNFIKTILSIRSRWYYDWDFNDNRNILYEIVMEFLETAWMNDLEYFDEYIQLSANYEIYWLSSLSELFSSFFFHPEILSNLKFNN